MKIRNNWSYEPVHDKTEITCALSSVWLDSVVGKKKLCVLCLPIKCIVKTLIRLGGWPRCGFVRFFDDFWTGTGPYTPWLKDEHEKLSDLMDFWRFWAHRVSCMVQKTPICLHRPALHLKGHLPKPVGYGFMLYWAKNHKNTQRTGIMHLTIASQEGDFVQTSHRRQTPMAPQVIRAGALPWVSCMRPKHWIFYA